MEDEQWQRTACFVGVFTHPKIGGSKFFRAVIQQITDGTHNMVMPLVEVSGNFKRRGGRAAMMQGDGWGKVVGGQKLGLGHVNLARVYVCHA